MPHYGWQSSAAGKPQSNQPYSSYLGTCTPCTLTSESVPRRTTFTEAGGYAPVGKSVGVVTVRNMRTGQSGRTAALGSGIRRGALSPQVTVEVGDSYQITHTGTVYKAEADGYIVSIFGVGGGAWPLTTAGHGADRAELFALTTPLRQHGTPPPPRKGFSRVAPAKRRRGSGEFACVRPSFRRVRGSSASARRRVVGRLRCAAGSGAPGRVGVRAARWQSRSAVRDIGEPWEALAWGRADASPCRSARCSRPGAWTDVPGRDSSRALQGGAGAGATPGLASWQSAPPA